MRSPRLGCITPFGLAAAIITGLVIAFAGIAGGGAMFAPGALNAVRGPEAGGVTAHADLAGRCSSCHTAPWESAGIADRCLDCHIQVQAEMADPGTLHGALIHNKQEEFCLNCHTEHNGPQGSLTRLDIENFPHDVTGFSLEAHAQHPNGSAFTCQDCHDEKYRQMSAAACETCHAQEDAAYMSSHRSAFGSACLNCHDGVDRYGKDFDHSRTDFALIGAHASLGCEHCHMNQTTMAAVSSTALDCAACHAADDAHRGSLGADCTACHNSEAWQPATFDHARSTFPLTGAHQAVACAACHANQQFQGTPAACSACHADDDHHNGQFGGDCALCHVTASWQEVIFDHAQSRFPLTGAHTGLPCLRCHQDAFRGTPTACSACHSEPAFHAGLFLADCAACHSTSAWSPASFGGPHTFPVNHEGADSCRDCHTNSLASFTCYTCHDQGETIAEHRDEGIGDLGNCISCHPTGQEEEGGDGGEDDD